MGVPSCRGLQSNLCLYFLVPHSFQDPDPTQHIVKGPLDLEEWVPKSIPWRFLSPWISSPVPSLTLSSFRIRKRVSAHRWVGRLELATLVSTAMGGQERIPIGLGPPSARSHRCFCGGRFGSPKIDEKGYPYSSLSGGPRCFDILTGDCSPRTSTASDYEDAMFHAADTGHFSARALPRGIWCPAILLEVAFASLWFPPMISWWRLF